MTLTVTEWFDGDVHPVYPGEYDRRYVGPLQDEIDRCRWTGSEWLMYFDKISAFQPWENADKFQWRGVTEPQDEFWHTQDGRLIAVSDMDGHHCRNVLRMVLRKVRRAREGKTALLRRLRSASDAADEDLHEDRKWGSE